MALRAIAKAVAGAAAGAAAKAAASKSSSSSGSSSKKKSSSPSGGSSTISYDQYLDNKQKAESGLLTGDALNLASSQNAAYRAATGMQDASYYDTRFNPDVRPTNALYPGDLGFGGYSIGGKQYTQFDFDRLHEAILKPNDSGRQFKALHTNTDGSFNPYGGGGHALYSNGALAFSGDNDYSQYGQPGTRRYDEFMMNLDPVNYKSGGVPFTPTSEYYQDPYNYAEMVNQGRISPQVAGAYDENINWLPIPQQPQQLQANMLPSAMIPFAIPDFEYDIPMPEEYRKDGTIFTPTLAMVDQWQQGRQQAHGEYRARYQDEWSRYMNMLDEAYRRDAMNLDEAYRRDNMNLGQQNLYYQQQGLTPGMSANDPSAQIRELQRIATEASKVGDMDRFNWAHNEAERLRIAAGWGSGGDDGSLTQHMMSLAGTPTWERQVYESPEQQAMRELAVQEAQAKVAATQALQTQRLASASKSSSGGSTKPKEPTQKDWEGAIMSTSGYYKTGADYLADLKRNKSAIVKVAGADGYRRLEKEAEGMKYDKGSDFKPGSASPLRTALRNAGVI